MENEQRHYELRSASRSRSRTPLVQGRILIEPEISEHHYELRSRSRERSHTPGEVTSNKRSSSRILPGSSNKTNDQSTETIVEKKKEFCSIDDTLDVENKQFEGSSVCAKKGERRSERQKAKRQIFANGHTDNKDDSSGHKRENIHKDISCTTFTSDYSSEETEQDDLSSRPRSAHEIYKQAGDWWNVFPKTDYTYSERSKCRYEIAPGILAMPNMSRRSIHSNTEDFSRFTNDSFGNDVCDTTNIEKERATKVENYTLNDDVHGSNTLNFDGKSKLQYTKMHVEQYHCHREVIYAEPNSKTNSRLRKLPLSDLPLKRIDSRKRDVTSSFDSDSELDEVVLSNNNRRSKVIQRFMTFTSVIILWFSKLLEFLKLKTVKRREYCATYEYQRYESKWFRMWERVDHFLQYIYLFMVKVFFFDSWLLSRIASTRRWMHQRSSKAFWVALLPLLLLTGCWYLPYHSTLFLPTKVMHQVNETPELITSDKRSFLKGEFFAEGNNFVSITEELYNRVNSLEDRAIQQSDRVLLLEKRIEEFKLLDAYAQEIDAVKTQLERLKEVSSELKLCCNSHMSYVTIEDLEKRIETILAHHFHTLMPKTEKIEVKDKLWISDDNSVTDDRVREIIKEALKIYDADKTGRVDYALESAGGQIISTRCTQRYDIKTRAFKLLAFTLYHENNNPRTVIQGNPIQPGVCWAFQGFPGYLLIKLRSSIYVTGFTVEHVPKLILPNEEMRSAPKKFNVWGFVDENDSDPVLFGDYEFAASDDSLQYFPVQNTAIKTPYEYVELRVHSNHGQLEYTCLYRFRVHGKPV